MNKKEKTDFILKTLNKYFPHPKVFLKAPNDFCFLISVLLSAHTTDNIVNKVTPELFKKAKTPKKMSTLSIQEIEKIIKPCGLSKRKAKGVLGVSKIIQEKYRGKIPDNFSDLEALPSVGHKTASVIMAFVFKKDAFPVDTHITRLAKRWHLSSGKSIKKIEEDLKKNFPKNTWRKLHLQMIYFGKNYCKARGHKKSDCPICSSI